MFLIKNMRKAILTITIALFFTVNLFAAVTNKDEALLMGKKAFEDGFYEVSIGLLERYLAGSPGSPGESEAGLLIAQCYFHQNRFFEALKKLEALSNDPKNNSLKDAVYYWMAEVHFKCDNLRKAAELYSKLLSEYPSSAYAPVAYYSLGWSLAQLGDYQQALDNFRILEKKFPKEPQAKEAAFKIIECLYNLKDYSALKEQVKPYLKVYGAEPLRLAYLYFYLAESDYYLGDFEAASQNYAKAYSVTNEDKVKASVRLGLGWSYLKLKKYKEAEDVFAEINAGNLDKKSMEVLLLGKALLMFQNNRPNEAKKIYTQILASNSDHFIRIQAYLGIGDVCYNLAEYSQAIKAYQQGLLVNATAAANETISSLRYNLSLAYLKLGQLPEGLGELKAIIKSDAEQPAKLRAFCALGDAYQSESDFTRAQESYNKILTDYPGLPGSDYAQYQLGVIALKRSDLSGAISNLANFSNKYPASGLIDDAVYTLGLAYFHEKDYNNCLKILSSFKDFSQDNLLQAQALYLSASSLMNLGRFNEAVAEFKKIMNRFSQDKELVQKAEYQTADCFYKMNNEQEAVARFKGLRAKYPDSDFAPEVIWWLGEYYYRNNDFVMARRYFSSLINDYPKSALLGDAYHILGTTYLDEKKFAIAQENFENALKFSNPQNRQLIVLSLVDSLFLQENYNQLVSACTELADKYPDSAGVIYQKLAEAYYKENDYTLAVQYYQKSLKSAAPAESVDLRFKLAESFEAAGNFEAAADEYQKVANLGTRDNLTVRALLRLAKIYEDKEDFKKAISVYNKIVQADTQESELAKERLDWIKANNKL
jgi:tetratricopeptide (TPR) repeat protein